MGWSSSVGWSSILAGIVGLGLLMVVHEGGHLLMARAFGMRVTRFSIGFGPTLWRHQPKQSDTVYQVALIPFLAYVQIAGMNPFEETDVDDKGSYANASLIGRIATIFAGPLANYLFASVFFFFALVIGGRESPTTEIRTIAPNSAAAKANLRLGDRVVAIDGKTVADWDRMKSVIVRNPKKLLEIEVLRKGQRVRLPITPEKDPRGEGKIGISPVSLHSPVGVQEALVDSVVLPARTVQMLVLGLAKAIADVATGKGKPELSGPIGIVGEFSKAAEEGLPYFLTLLGMLSAYIGGFNLIPFPALDGGRLMFLGYEAVTRKRPEPRLEAQIHMVGLLLLLAVILLVTIGDVRALVSPRGQ